MRPCGGLVIAALVAGCTTSLEIPLETVETDTDTDTDADTDTDTDADPGPTGPLPETYDLAAGRYEALFDPTVLHVIAIDLAAADWDAMGVDGTAWLPATVSIDGEVLPLAGVELTGDQAAFGWDGKVDLRLDFDQYFDDLTYGAMEHLALDDQAADPTGVREALASRVYVAAGVAAPRAALATVVIQGGTPLLYTVREEVDEAMIGRFWQSVGDLWEGGDGADFTVAGLPLWEGSGDPAALEAARVAIQTSGAAFEAEVGAVLALDPLRALWAWQAVIGNPDGWPFELDDVWAYADPADAGRFVFVPERIDEAFNAATVWDAVAADVAIRCRFDAACAEAIEAELTAAADAYDAFGAAAWAADALLLTEAAAFADPEGAYLPGARDGLVPLVEARGDAIRAAIP